MAVSRAAPNRSHDVFKARSGIVIAVEEGLIEILGAWQRDAPERRLAA